MLLELLDQRLTKILPKSEYFRLKAQAETAFAKIENQTPEPAFQNILDLLFVLNEIQQCLLEDRFRERYDYYEVLSRHPVG